MVKCSGYAGNEGLMSFPIDPGTVIHRTGAWTVVLNRNQNLLGKVMLILNRPCEDVRLLGSDEWIDLHDRISNVTAALDSLFKPDHYNYSFLMNLDRQVHLHVTPRYAGPRIWNDVEFRDPRFGTAAGTDQRTLPDEIKAAMVETLRERLRDPA